MRDVQASSRPQKTSRGRWRAWISRRALLVIPIQLKSENRLEAKLAVDWSTCSVPSYFNLPFSAAIDEQPHAAELTPVGRISGAFATCSLRGLTAGSRYSAICEHHTTMLLFASLVLCNQTAEKEPRLASKSPGKLTSCGWQKGW